MELYEIISVFTLPLEWSAELFWEVSSWLRAWCLPWQPALGCQVFLYGAPSDWQSYWTVLCKLQSAIHCARCMTHRALQVSRCQISVACGIPCLVVFGRRVASTHTNTCTLPTSKAIQLSFWLFASYQQDLDMFQTLRILACCYCRFALDLHSCMGWLESAGLALQNAQHLHWRFTSTPTQLPEPCQLECSAWGHTHTAMLPMLQSTSDYSLPAQARRVVERSTESWKILYRYNPIQIHDYIE